MRMRKWRSCKLRAPPPPLPLVARLLTGCQAYHTWCGQPDVGCVPSPWCSWEPLNVRRSPNMLWVLVSEDSGPQPWDPPGQLLRPPPARGAGRAGESCGPLSHPGSFLSPLTVTHALLPSTHLSRPSHLHPFALACPSAPAPPSPPSAHPSFLHLPPLCPSASLHLLIPPSIPPSL